ncbi:endo alpha-1,4 polygalactosaminidase [Pilimelia columellifera subsp. columellifera]|uniref:Endo alpha-1,4 polygalactosaminidase n=1 Tax=Pilimelia columellifera subsp. columellifera TaxID=706583 RepID=A0ABN3NMU8_9ACTN
MWQQAREPQAQARPEAVATATPSAAVATPGPVASVKPSPKPSLKASPSAKPALRWKPKLVAGQTWQLQLKGPVQLSVKADVYDIDGADATAAQITALHARGAKAICYINAGAWEDWRADRGRYPSSVIGKPMDGWAGERWLDIRRWSALEPILRGRFADCRRKGFDGVDPDNMDGYTQRSGFTITAAEQLTFNRRVAALARSMGLAVGLKNNLSQVNALAGDFDFAVNESCVRFNECHLLRPFLRAGKPVFHVEYNASLGDVCPTSRRLALSSILAEEDLTGPRQAC